MTCVWEFLWNMMSCRRKPNIWCFCLWISFVILEIGWTPVDASIAIVSSTATTATSNAIVHNLRDDDDATDSMHEKKEGDISDSPLLWYDSIPAVFGLPWPPGHIFYAQLIEIPSRPFLCEPHDSRDRILRQQHYHRGNSHKKHHHHHTQDEDIPSDNEEDLDHDSSLSSAMPLAVLVHRGGCSFEVKARTAMTLKPSVDFVIVYDDRSQSQLIPMSANQPENITERLLFVSKETGKYLHEMLVKLREQNSSAKKALIVAMDSRVPYDQYSFDDRKDWIMVSMSGFFVILACVSSLLVCLQAGFIPGASPSLLLGGDLMTEAQVLKLPSVRYSDTMNQDHQINQTSCPICMEDYTDEIDLRCLPCGHLFHSECILPWLIERHATCPLCKQHVLVEEDTNSATWNHEPWSAYGLFLHQFLGFSNQGRTLVATEDQDSSLTDAIHENNGNDNSQVN